MISTTLAAIGLGAISLLPGAASYGDSCNDNNVVYWGQNSYGAVNSADTANFQKSLATYCQDDSIDVIPIAFLDVYQGTGGLPEINLANTCNTVDDQVFAGSQLLNCSFIADDIKTCQAAGKKVTLSIGGAGAGGGTADSAFADQIWDLFLGGSSSTRPFGDAILDGVDLDIEGGTTSYVDFVNQLRTHFAAASKKYYVTAAPQCPYPDAYIGASLNGAEFDAVYVQFYNNACSVTAYGTSAWNFGTWDYWANRISPNKDVKVYLGVPASSTAAGSGYVSIDTLSPIIIDLQKNFPSFGGVMMWDASQAAANSNFQAAAKNALTSGGSCSGFTYSACTAEAWSPTGTYPQGSQVTYDNYIWEARYYGSGTPTASDTGSWVPISACGGSSSTSSSTSSTASTSTTLASTSLSSTSSSTSKFSTSTVKVSTITSSSIITTNAPPATTTATSTPFITTSSVATGGSCDGVSAWSASEAYVGGSDVTYDGQLWTNSWWSEGDTPGGSAGVWASKGSC